AVEDARRVRAHHARTRHRTIHADRELYLHLARDTRTQGVRREPRRRRADRAQHRRGRRRGLAPLGLASRRFLALGLEPGGFLAFGLASRRLLALGLEPGGLRRGLLLQRQLPRRLLLLAALRLEALALELLATLGLLLRGQLLLLQAPRDGGLGRSDGAAQALQCRMRRVGLLDQRQQAAGLGEILAVAALLGGDDHHRQQVDQRARHPRVARLLVAQREVVLHGVVAR